MSSWIFFWLELGWIRLDHGWISTSVSVGCFVGSLVGFFQMPILFQVKKVLSELMDTFMGQYFIKKVTNREISLHLGAVN